ncbi:hypothetical protein FT663_04839 [Candidozyma haemuli var. vulneris]|nr:hypothetical protein FT663_04839 [[Candida] haemuloni var. vulneris]KAF3988861.1 hypothetical protein FT662_03170 [[Candida] haemuloni var. vulneris]
MNPVDSPLNISQPAPMAYPMASFDSNHTDSTKNPSTRQPLGPPPPAPADSASTTMNYSPRHSRKPSSLSTSRNINMKQLSLNLSSTSSSPSDMVPNGVSDPIMTLSPSRNGHKKPPALAIPHNPSVSAPLVTPVVASTPLIPPAPPIQKSRGHSLRSSPVIPPSEFSLGVSPPHFAPSSPEAALSSPFGSVAHLHSHNVTSIDQIEQLDPYKHSHTHQGGSSGPFHAPEELQEQSNLYAYPNGPARVLDDTLFLFSDPKYSVHPVDVNDYDLVVNVAKDCEDLSPEFDTKGGQRTYLHIPWSHTSSISKELPNITATIAKYDKPGSKILVHCQCGVSRSACVVVAYYMVKFNISVNDAYELLKSGTSNTTEACNRRIAKEGYHIDACERICPNMSLIFELMDFDENRKAPAENNDE